MADGLGPPLSPRSRPFAQARGRVIVTGMGKSGHVARKIAATLASTGTPAFFVHAADASHGDLGMITSDDVMLVLVLVGRDRRAASSLIDYSRRFRITLIAVTVNAESTLGKAADIVLALPAAREACPHNLAPTTSIADAACAWRRARHRASRKPRLHRGRFRRVSSAAASSARRSNSSATSCIRATPCRSSRAARRCRRRSWKCRPRASAASPSPMRAGRLAGVITDGDLRRHMRDDLLRAPVDEVMTASPKTVRPGQLASEALEHLNASKITALIVVEKRPAGRHRAFPRSLARRRRLSRPARGQTDEFRPKAIVRHGRTCSGLFRPSRSSFWRAIQTSMPATNAGTTISRDLITRRR